MVAAAMEMKQEKLHTGISKAKSLSYKKRKECIKKKTMELSVLCDIKACVVILEPNGEIETWPENPDNVREILNLYKDFNRKNNNNKVRVFGPSVKVETCPEITKTDDDLGTKNGCNEGRLPEAVKQEAWDDSWLAGLSEESIQELLKEIDTKLELLSKRIDFLKRIGEGKKYNDKKGKEIALWDGEAGELQESFLIDIKDFVENETSEDCTKTPNLEGVSLSEKRIFSDENNLFGKQTIPSFEPRPKRNVLENQCVQISQFHNLCNNSGMGFYQGTIMQQSAQVPNQFSFQNTSSTTDHGKFFFQEISVPEQSNQIPDQCQWFDSSAYESRMLDVMPKELYAQFQDGMLFSGGRSSMEPTMPTPFWFDDNSVLNGGQSMLRCLPDLCQQPMQDFSELDNLNFSLIEEPSSSALQQNMQY